MEGNLDLGGNPKAGTPHLGSMSERVPGAAGTLLVNKPLCMPMGAC